MRQRNVNRLVWANGFTNDKSAYSNKEPFKKQCTRCTEIIWISPENKGWKALNTDGTEHKCLKVKKKVTGGKEYKKKCKFCGAELNMKFLAKKNWVALNADNTKHRCNRGENDTV